MTLNNIKLSCAFMIYNIFIISSMHSLPIGNIIVILDH